MAMTLSTEMRSVILTRYAENMAIYPRKHREVEAFLRFLREDHSICLQFLYAFMHTNDVVSFEIDEIYSYVSATLLAFEKIPYMRSIPEDIFLSYVLSHRVNDEYLDTSRIDLFEVLLPRVTGKSMYAAALEVNYWCYAHCTYQMSDDRTLGPLAVIRSTYGRCGEESLFTVSTLRSVGIPARQSYVPRWSHCDDNHAWVEVWVDGAWHFLGACEPEPMLDKGWFTASASKAMLTHSRAWSTILVGEEVAYTTSLYTLVHSTPLYALCTDLQVKVTRNGLPVASIPVKFQIVNYSELYTLFQTETDEYGLVHFRTGYGDLYINVLSDGILVTRCVDVRHIQQVNLDLAEGVPLYGLDDTHENFILVPPKERVLIESNFGMDHEHYERLMECEAERNSRWNSFVHEDDGRTYNDYRCKARGNLKEIERFLSDTRFTEGEKRALLSTLRAKDFIDASADMLCDAVLSARPFAAQYPEEVFNPYILAPRVADEMLLPQRFKIRGFFSNSFQNAPQVLCWLKDHIRILPDDSAGSWYASAYGSLLHGCTGARSFGLLFVSVCRAFGIPARINPHTFTIEWFTLGSGGPVSNTDGAWVSEHPQDQHTLCLVNHSGFPMRYGEQFTISRLEDSGFQTLRYPGLMLEEVIEFTLLAGVYQLLTTVRQIDGTASVKIHRFNLRESRTIDPALPEDDTLSRIQEVDIFSSLAAGPVKTLMSNTSGLRRILIWAEPGKEPTEHLLLELLACQSEFLRAGYGIYILITSDARYYNLTLSKVEAALSTAQVQVTDDLAAFSLLHLAMGIGDLRLPFVLALDEMNHGLYASANYNINMAQTLLKIQRLSAQYKENR